MSQIIDRAWFDRYRAIKITVGDAYEILEPLPETLSAKKKAFEDSNYLENVELLSDRVDAAYYASLAAELDVLRSDIEKIETSQLLREVYFDAIHDLQATISLIIAGSNGNKEAYATANSALYNKPDEAIFKAVCHWIRSDAEASLEGTNERVRDLASDILVRIPDLHDNHQILVPSERVFHRVRLAHRQNGGYYDQLFRPEGLPTAPYIAQTEGDEICRRVLDTIDPSWTIGTAENNLWAVMRSRKELVRPLGYRLDRDEFTGIVCHEIGSHILEEVNGGKLPLKLLSTGLAGFEKANEGRAFLREQIIYDSERTFLRQFAWEYIVLLHLSVSLASGLYKKPYTFVELYSVIFVLYSFWREKRMPESANNEAFARDEAWYLAVRIMKGTEGTGGCYMKDSVYLEGNIRCWQLAQDDPNIILFGDHGMFDVTNKRHVEIVRMLL